MGLRYFMMHLLGGQRVVACTSISFFAVRLARGRQQMPAQLAPDLFDAGRRIQWRVRAALLVLADELLRRAGGVGHGRLAFRTRE